MIKVAIGTFTPASLVLARTGIAALMLLPVAAYRGELRPLLKYWKPLLAYTLAELAVPWLLLSTAEQRLSSSLTGLLIAAVPLVGALLSRLTGGDRLGPRRLGGLLVGIAGVGCLVGFDLHGGDVPALVEICVVVVGYAVGPFLLSRYLADAPAIGVVAGSLVLTGIGYLPVGIAQFPRHWPPLRVTGAVLVLAVVCTTIAFLVFFALIEEIGPVRATVITYINPAVAVALGVLLLHEPFTIAIGVGFALVLLGSVLATRKKPEGTINAGEAEVTPA
jgi:drug/metabolite transporter (DMT)-like permease